MSDDSVEADLNRLADEWNTVYVCVRGEPTREDGQDRVHVRNCTDEGLGAEERKTAYGATLEEALERAFEGDYRSPWDRDG